MNLSLVLKKVFPLLVALALLVVSHGNHPISSAAGMLPVFTIDADTAQSDPASTLESDDCYPNSGWTWTTGPWVPEIALEVQQELSQIGIEAVVEARAYGETDSCGTFRQSGLDFTITLRSEERISQARQERLADELYPILVRFGKPNLGNVKIAFPDGNTISLNDKKLADQLAALGLDTGVLEDTWQVTPASTPSPGVLNKQVYVIVYDPLLSGGQLLSEYLGWYSHAALTQGTVDFFAQASGGRINYTVVETTIVTDGWPEKTDGFIYTEEEYLGVIDGTIPAHDPDSVSYNAIVNSPAFDICGKANRGEIDEVWIFNGPYFGFYESTLVGPDAYWYNSPPVPEPFECERLIPIMGPSPERGLDCSIENFGHRTESTMTQVYGSWLPNSTAHNWERFALVAFQSPDYSYSGCGSIHYPPNGTSDYDYSNPDEVMSNCDDFENYPDLSEPSTVLEPVTCSEWSCSHLDYFDYWFGHFPRNAGCGPDDVANNWWRYFGEPALALDPPLACEPLEATLSINYATGEPGSFFTVTGLNFPADGAVTVEINGILVDDALVTDLLGNLAFILDTTEADAGWYYVTATVNPSLTIRFDLDPAEPFRPQSGEDPIIVVPGGIAWTDVIYLPLVLR